MGLKDIPGTDAEKVERNQKIAEKAEELEKASNGILTERQAHAYVARDMAGLSRQEAMALLGVQPSTVDSLYYKAQDKIRGAEALVDEIS